MNAEVVGALHVYSGIAKCEQCVRHTEKRRGITDLEGLQSE
jgi:hypothetical protein